MVEKAEEEGRIKPGDTLIEPTSGNTGPLGILSPLRATFNNRRSIGSIFNFSAISFVISSISSSESMDPWVNSMLKEFLINSEILITFTFP